MKLINLFQGSHTLREFGEFRKLKEFSNYRKSQGSSGNFDFFLKVSGKFKN